MQLPRPAFEQRGQQSWAHPVEAAWRTRTSRDSRSPWAEPRRGNRGGARGRVRASTEAGLTWGTGSRTRGRSAAHVSWQPIPRRSRGRRPVLRSGTARLPVRPQGQYLCSSSPGSRSTERRAVEWPPALLPSPSRRRRPRGSPVRRSPGGSPPSPPRPPRRDRPCGQGRAALPRRSRRTAQPWRTRHAPRLGQAEHRHQRESESKDTVLRSSGQGSRAAGASSTLRIAPS
jgi:hypothetical protein